MNMVFRSIERISRAGKRLGKHSIKENIMKVRPLNDLDGCSGLILHAAYQVIFKANFNLSTKVELNYM